MTMNNSHISPLHKWLDFRHDIEDTFSNLIDQPWGRNRPDWVPQVDIDETTDAYVVTIDLPGVCEDEVELHVEARRIEIRGTRTYTETRASATRIHTERTVGRFRRGFRLEHAVDPDSATSRYSDGVYEITIKKRSANS